MPRIRCHYLDCVLLDDGYCGAAAIELDPDVGCMTYKRSDDLIDAEESGKEKRKKTLRIGRILRSRKKMTSSGSMMMKSIRLSKTASECNYYQYLYDGSNCFR